MTIGVGDKTANVATTEVSVTCDKIATEATTEGNDTGGADAEMEEEEMEDIDDDDEDDFDLPAPVFATWLQTKTSPVFTSTTLTV